MAAWREFRKGKRNKKDVAMFELNLEDNIFQLHNELLAGKWKPDPYVSFGIKDPKPRIIHKASVRDRVFFQAVYRKLYPVFDPSFIFDSYSSRNGKGTHAGVKKLEVFSRKATENYRKVGFVLKCDIRKFFDSLDHKILLKIIGGKIHDPKFFVLIQQIVRSFEKLAGKGLPLGNVTSQLFANIYLNELDQFVKHKIKARLYIRYCDDFVILSESLEVLKGWISRIRNFCLYNLSLNLHERKTVTRKFIQGVDFLGYVSLPHRRVLRTKTRRRILNRVSIKNLPSYLGMCSHGREKRFANAISIKGSEVVDYRGDRQKEK